MAKIPTYISGAAPLAADPKTPTLKSARTVAVDMSGLAAAAGGMPTADPSAMVRASAAGGAAISKAFGAVAKVSGEIAQAELKARVMRQVNDADMAMADAAIEFDSYMAKHPNETKWGESWAAMSKDRISKMLSDDNLAPVARQEIERRAKSWASRGATKISGHVLSKSLALTKQSLNIGWERAVASGNMSGADDIVAQLVEGKFASPQMGQMLREEARRQDESNRAALSFNDAVAFINSDPVGGGEALENGFVTASKVQVSTFGYEQKNEPGYDYWSSRGIGDHSNALVENLSVALSPSILLENNLPPKSDGREIVVVRANGQRVVAKWSDKTADKFEGKTLRRVDFFNRQGPVSFDGEDVTLEISSDGLDGGSRQKLKRLQKQVLSTQNAENFSQIVNDILTSNLVTSQALENRLSLTDLPEVDKLKARSLFADQNKTPQDRPEDWAIAYKLSNAFPHDPPKEDGKWSKQYSDAYKYISSRLSDTGGRAAMLAELDYKFLGKEPKDKSLYNKAYDYGKKFLERGFGNDDDVYKYYLEDNPVLGSGWFGIDTQKDEGNHRKEFDRARGRSLMAADQMLRGALQSFVESSKREPDEMEMQEIVDSIFKSARIMSIDLDGQSTKSRMEQNKNLNDFFHKYQDAP